MSPQRSAQVLGLFQTLVVASWIVAWLAGLGSAGTQNTGIQNTGIQDTGAAAIEDRRQPSFAAAALADALQATARGNAPVGRADVATVTELVTAGATDGAAGSDEPKAIAEATLAASSLMQPPATPPVQVAALSLPDPGRDLAPDATPGAASDEPKPVAGIAARESPQTQPSPAQPLQLATASPSDRLPNDTMNAVGPIESPDACPAGDACIDRYLWAVYQRTPKEDSIKVDEQRKVTIKKKGKLVTVTRTFTKLVDEDFAWKDPKAAERAGMPMMDYVVGGMDQSFKLKLFHLLRAAEEAGLAPGITSAFRDDYRQSIASGLKAASDRSYHGGSSRGGYGHGLAADVVSIKGETRDQRYASSEALWKWIDAHGEEFGIGRPYLDRDPPHVAPIDGKEYAAHHGAKTQHAEARTKKHGRLAGRDDRDVAKRPKTARSSKVRTI